MVIAWVCNKRSDFAGIYAGKLFGGSYILCLYIGMLFGKYYKNTIRIEKKQLKIIIAGVSSVITLYFGILFFYSGFFLDSFPILGSVINPPGVTEIVYAFFILITICFWGQLVSPSSSKILNLLVNGLSYIGGQTLFIFLYHRLFLDYLLNRFFCGFNTYFKIPIFYIIMIFGSIAIGYLYKLFIKLVKSSYLYVKG